MKVLLIGPPFTRLKGQGAAFFPIGLGYLASTLMARGFETWIYNAEIPRKTDPPVGRRFGSYADLMAQHDLYARVLRAPDHFVWQEVRDVVTRYHPDIVGISIRSPEFPSAMKVASIVKSALPACRIVVGGPHPTMAPDECLEEACIDFVVRGEGEKTMAELCLAIGSSRPVDEIAGLSFRRSGTIVHNPPRPLLEDLDILPFPGRHLMVDLEACEEVSMGVLVTSRGCPFHCGYCSAANIWSRKVRIRSTENVIREIKETIARYGVKSFFFWDDSMTVNRRRVVALCEALRREKLGIKWACTTRVDIVDDELLGIMKEAGCVRIDIGIETGSPRMMKLIDKRITIEQVEKAIRLIKKHRIIVEAFFMIGFPEETEEDMRQTIALAGRLKIFVKLSVFTPYPGTPLFERAKSLGLIPEKIDWTRFDHQSPENCFVKDMEKEEFNRLKEEMLGIVDRLNADPMRRLESLRASGGFYFRNPRAFFEGVARVFRRRLRNMRGF